MIVWGGGTNDGGRYNPTANSWARVTTNGAPVARNYHTAVWGGSEMIIWGGQVAEYYNTGGRYNPTTDGWTAITTNSAPKGRSFHTAVWAGNDMLIWGGYNNGQYFNDTSSYTPPQALYLYYRP